MLHVSLLPITFSPIKRSTEKSTRKCKKDNCNVIQKFIQVAFVYVASVSDRDIAPKLEREPQKGKKGEGERRREKCSLFNQHYHNSPIRSCVRGRTDFKNREISGRGSFSPLPQSSFIPLFRSCSNFLDEPVLKRLVRRLKTDTNINIPLKTGNTAPLNPC